MFLKLIFEASESRVVGAGLLFVVWVRKEKSELLLGIGVWP